MLLGVICLSNNNILEGKMLSVKLKVFNEIQERLNPFLKDDFVKLRNNFKYDVSEIIEMKSSKEDIVSKYAVKKYKIIVRYNLKNYWEFDDIDKDDIIIHDNDIIKEEAIK